MRYISFLVILLLFVSCNKTKEMDKDTISIKVISNYQLADDVNSDLPEAFKVLLDPIDFSDSDVAYIPLVTIQRIDIPDSKLETILVPKETANSLRSYFGTYDYNNLTDDYKEFKPLMKAGELLSKKSSLDTTLKSKPEDCELYFKINISNKVIDLDSIKSVIESLKMSLTKKNGPMKVVIFLNNTNNKVSELIEPIEASDNYEEEVLPVSKTPKNENIPTAEANPCGSFVLSLSKDRNAIVFNETDYDGTIYNVKIIDIDPPSSGIEIYNNNLTSNSIKFPISIKDYKLINHRNYKIIVSVMKNGKVACTKQQVFNLENESTVNSTCKFNGV